MKLLGVSFALNTNSFPLHVACCWLCAVGPIHYRWTDHATRIGYGDAMGPRADHAVSCGANRLLG